MRLGEFDFLDWAHKQPEMQVLRERFKEILRRQREGEEE
tara:strand:- start:200 stop:316 length:117 start_codon:yes stop_codon:yes gene_type:complete